MMNQTNIMMKDEKDIQKRIVTEIEFLKGKPDILERPGTGDVNIENLRKERNELLPRLVQTRNKICTNASGNEKLNFFSFSFFPDKKIPQVIAVDMTTTTTN